MAMLNNQRVYTQYISLTSHYPLALLPPQQLQRWRDDLLQQRRQGAMPRDVAGDAQHALGQGLTWAPRLEKGDLLWRIYMDFYGCRMIYVENLWIFDGFTMDFY